jgi:hypothetical protein
MLWQTCSKIVAWASFEFRVSSFGFRVPSFVLLSTTTTRTGIPKAAAARRGYGWVIHFMATQLAALCSQYHLAVAGG